MCCRSTTTVTMPVTLASWISSDSICNWHSLSPTKANAEMNLIQASDQLANLDGLSDSLAARFDITGDHRSAAGPGTLTDLEQKALAARPDYRAAQAAVRVADANVKLAYANGTTDPTLEGEYERSWQPTTRPALASTFRCAFSIVTRATKTRANIWRRPAGSARSRRRIRSIPTWTRPGLDTPLLKCFPTATTVTILPKRRMSYRLRNLLTNAVA